MDTYRIVSEALNRSPDSDWTKNPLVNKVADFLMENPNPKDSAVHSLAESMGVDVHKLESIFYFLATKAAQLLRQGRMNEKGITEKDVDPKELAMGIKVELEHSDCKRIAKKISLDHLAEMPDYYTRLAKMEKEGGIEH